MTIVIEAVSRMPNTIKSVLESGFLYDFDGTDQFLGVSCCDVSLIDKALQATYESNTKDVIKYVQTHFMTGLTLGIPDVILTSDNSMRFMYESPVDRMKYVIKNAAFAIRPYETNHSIYTILIKGKVVPATIDMLRAVRK